jgi:hypothetical protein
MLTWNSCFLLVTLGGCGKTTSLPAYVHSAIILPTRPATSCADASRVAVDNGQPSVVATGTTLEGAPKAVVDSNGNIYVLCAWNVDASEKYLRNIRELLPIMVRRTIDSSSSSSLERTSAEQTAATVEPSRAQTAEHTST